MAIRILLISSTGLRHRYVANKLAAEFNLAGILTEEKSVSAKSDILEDDILVQRHLVARDLVEQSFLEDRPFPDVPIRRMERGQANSPEALEWVEGLAPDAIVLFGSGIIAPPLLNAFKDRVINLHLGLSPYYRGSGTNLFPLVDGLPEYVGATVHLAVPAVDAGPVLAQARPVIAPDDHCHEIGTKALMAGVSVLKGVLPAYLSGDRQVQMQNLNIGRVMRRRDFNAEALRTMHAKFATGSLFAYLMDKEQRDKAAPIYLLS